jgi:hypothetical protein
MNKLQEQKVRELIREQINEVQRVSVMLDLVDWLGNTLERLAHDATPIATLIGSQPFNPQHNYKELANIFFSIIKRGASALIGDGSVTIIRKLKDAGIAPETAQQLLDTELPASVLKFMTYNLAAGSHNFNPGVKAPKELKQRITSGQIKTMQQVIDFVKANKDQFYDV